MIHKRRVARAFPEATALRFRIGRNSADARCLRDRLATLVTIRPVEILGVVRNNSRANANGSDVRAHPTAGLTNFKRLVLRTIQRRGRQLDMSRMALSPCMAAKKSTMCIVSSRSYTLSEGLLQQLQPLTLAGAKKRKRRQCWHQTGGGHDTAFGGGRRGAGARSGRRLHSRRGQ